MMLERAHFCPPERRSGSIFIPVIEGPHAWVMSRLAGACRSRGWWSIVPRFLLLRLATPLESETKMEPRPRRRNLRHFEEELPWNAVLGPVRRGGPNGLGRPARTHRGNGRYPADRPDLQRRQELFVDPSPGLLSTGGLIRDVHEPVPDRGRWRVRGTGPTARSPGTRCWRRPEQRTLWDKPI